MTTQAVLPAFWHAASLIAGHADFGALRPALAKGRLPPSPHSLQAAGFSARHTQLLRSGVPLDAPGDFLTMLSADWPQQLSPVPYAPPVLFYRGQLALLQAPAVAIVGSRRCTATGTAMARRLAQAVVDRGGVVVSGLAHGIDQAAHQASLAQTIAVLGQGLVSPMTARQQDLAQRIVAAGGLLVTEFLPATHPARWTFPQRNRIIAGLARATIVVEAAHKSGALITARQALAIGRDVLAVPGSPLSTASAGCLDLIADGAALARSGADLDSILPRQQALSAMRPSAQSSAQTSADLDALLQGGATMAQIAQLTRSTLAQAAATMMALELTGQVHRLPGDRFTTSHPD